MNCGLLGEKLGHSYSPQIHGMLSNYEYRLYEITPDQLPHFLEIGDFHGLNVTIPYKKAVIPFCDVLTAEAKKLGAVNTLVRQNDGKLLGHNTDYFGFKSMLHRSGLNVSNKKALVLGSGGASATVSAVLEELGANVVVISRSGSNNYSNLNHHKDATLIVNTTPIGMYPNTGVSPLSLDQFDALEGVLDVIYNPARTNLLLEAEAKGLITENGLWMLVAQAKESAEWFTGQQIDNSVIANIHHSLRRNMENTILIGMPGCGKSTIGEALAKETHRTFIDADIEIRKEAGMPIADIFENFGEEYFRKLETKVLAEICKLSGCVIATGGGCVTRRENFPLLHQNGKIIWIQRPLESLPTDGRPLSQRASLSDMYATRKPMYEAFADATVQNSACVASIVSRIIELEDSL